jgi:hypothetical protein
VPLVEWFLFHHVDSPEGSLVVAQSEVDVPFAIKRVYFLHSIPPTQVRGKHAHKALTQIAVAVKGSCSFHLDDGHDQADVKLDSPSRGIILHPNIWREMYDFTPDCVLLILASAHFDEADYIRDYEAFKHAARR